MNEENMNLKNTANPAKKLKVQSVPFHDGNRGSSAGDRARRTKGNDIRSDGSVFPEQQMQPKQSL